MAWAVIALGALLLGLVLQTGCAAHRAPPPLSADERALIAGGPLPYAVSVVPVALATGGNAAAYAQRLFRVLQSSGAFRVVKLEPTPSPTADLTAISTGMYCNTAVIPLTSILSVGLIPTRFDDEFCQGMVLRRARAGASGEPAVRIASSYYKGGVVWGWAAVLAGAQPGWRYGEPKADSRYSDRFGVEVLRRRADIIRLVGS